jgi:hypothetical protein
MGQGVYGGAIQGFRQQMAIQELPTVVYLFTFLPFREILCAAKP